MYLCESATFNLSSSTRKVARQAHFYTNSTSRVARQAHIHANPQFKVRPMVNKSVSAALSL